MSLKEIKDQVERDHPEWTPTEKMMLIKELRQREKAERAGTSQDEDGPSKPATVREAWVMSLILVIGMRLLGWAIWGSLTAEPHWYDVLYAVLFVAAVSGIVSAYRRR